MGAPSLDLFEGSPLELFQHDDGTPIVYMLSS